MNAVAIDGPSGAGKSTIARAAAQEIGFRYVDTGAIYRAVGYALWREGVNSNDVKAVDEVLRSVEITVTYDDEGLQRMGLNGEDVTEAIRLPEVSLVTSQAAALPEVRSYLLEMQREMAKCQSVVMDGRDIGTVVLPEADVKIFLTASEEDRARRRYEELVQRGMPKSYEKILEEVRARDYNDIHRAVSPLRPAADAVLLDTTGLAFEESLKLVLETIKERIKG